MALAHTEIWQHRTSGEQYIVRVDSTENGIIAATGPATHRDVERVQAGDDNSFRSDLAVVEDLAADLAAYRIVWPYRSA